MCLTTTLPIAAADDFKWRYTFRPREAASAQQRVQNTVEERNVPCKDPRAPCRAVQKKAVKSVFKYGNTWKASSSSNRLQAGANRFSRRFLEKVSLPWRRYRSSSEEMGLPCGFSGNTCTGHVPCTCTRCALSTCLHHNNDGYSFLDPILENERHMQNSIRVSTAKPSKGGWTSSSHTAVLH